MAKNFGKTGNIATFERVGMKAAEKAQVAVIQNISTLNLVDNPDNGEDITRTGDLELSIQENGFTDPIEVTDFGMEDGKYMILSGHRRRAAGVKTGMVIFPALVRHFKNKNEMVNYMLLSNSQRDSAKDPFLFSKRYKMHEQYLKDSGFTGNKREEIARRLGLSIQQADRYNTMNKVILPVWDMVVAENVGMSSVLPMASHSEAEQEDIYGIMQEALSRGVTLTRDCMKRLIDGYRDGKRTWAEIEGTQGRYQLPLNGFMNTEPGETSEPAETADRDGEARREYDPIAAEADRADKGRAGQEQTKASGHREDGTEYGERDRNGGQTPSPCEKDRQVKRAEDIMRDLQKLDVSLADIYQCRDADAGQEMLDVMGKVAAALIGEMYNLAEEYGCKSDFEETAGSIRKTLDSYS